MKLSFLWFNLVTDILEESKDFKYIVNMIRQSLTINEEIIQVCCTNDIKLRMQDFINIMLKAYCCICWSQGYNQEFKKAVSSSDNHFPYIFIMYPNETIGDLNIEF
jgi:hypothetical protein